MQFTGYLNGAIHQIDKIFCDRHTEAGALCLTYSGGMFALEGFKNMA